MWHHWTVRTRPPFRKLAEPQHAAWLWRTLRRNFPEALAAMIMPNHIHLVLPSAPNDIRVLRGVLGIFSRYFELKDLWEPIPPPKEVPDHLYLRRLIRYVALNPCRKQLCADPLEWTWSTYRDLMGATASPWLNFPKIQSATKDFDSRFAVRFHNYTSGDPSVSIEGTSFPKTAVPIDWPQESLAAILAAAASALQRNPVEVFQIGPLRDLFVHLSFKRGWTQTAVLAKACGISVRGVQYILVRGIDRTQVNAALFCLGDERLYKMQLTIYSPNAKKTGYVSTHGLTLSR